MTTNAMIFWNVVVWVGFGFFLNHIYTHVKQESYAKGRAHAFMEMAEALRLAPPDYDVRDLGRQLGEEAFRIREEYK